MDDVDVPLPSITTEYPGTSVSQPSKISKSNVTHEKASHKVFALEVLFLEENMASQ